MSAGYSAKAARSEISQQSPIAPLPNRGVPSVAVACATQPGRCFHRFSAGSSGSSIRPSFSACARATSKSYRSSSPRGARLCHTGGGARGARLCHTGGAARAAPHHAGSLLRAPVLPAPCAATPSVLSSRPCTSTSGQEGLWPRESSFLAPFVQKRGHVMVHALAKGLGRRLAPRPIGAMMPAAVASVKTQIFSNDGTPFPPPISQ